MVPLYHLTKSANNWCARIESNYYWRFRRPLFYPLNYEHISGDPRETRTLKFQRERLMALTSLPMGPFKNIADGVEPSQRGSNSNRLPIRTADTLCQNTRATIYGGSYENRTRAIYVTGKCRNH